MLHELQVQHKLNKVQSMGILQAIITNKETKFTKKVLEKHHLQNFFKLVVCGDTLTVKKPNPQVIKHCIQTLSIPAPKSLFVGDSEIDIFIHYKQLDYSESSEALNNYKKGDTVKFKIIDIKDDKVNGSVRALLDDPFDVFKGKKKGDIVTAKVAEILDSYIRVNVGEKRFSVIIRKAEIAVEKADQRTNRFAVGDALDAMIVHLDEKERKVGK